MTYFKTKKLNGKYESLAKIKTGSKKINASQEKALVNAYEKFKKVKDCVFYERNLSSQPTLNAAVKKSMKRNKDDDSDVYVPTQQIENKPTVPKSAGPSNQRKINTTKLTSQPSVKNANFRLS